ncbi:MAG: peptidoglycan DD-metalloendopeptidase family protein [Ignavibacteriae bacterium]|nr:peptidoglycan DD-metalloendopeptidase family protein [Ignavibacteriota bacterium]
MKKSLYYYSDKKLQFIEIKNFYSKFLSLVALFGLLSSLIIFGGYLFISSFINSTFDIESLSTENKILKSKYKEVANHLIALNETIDKLREKDDALRISVNLKPLQNDEKYFGIGGSEFKEILPTSISDVSNLLENLDNSINTLKTKITVAEENYNEIENSLKNNIKLFQSIPAILPADGNIGDRFGMRFHPILKISRMHTGLDVVVDTGTEIFAPGDGKVIEAGVHYGYGNTIQVDHGFGYVTLYAHLSKIKVSKGQKVKRGDLIGLSGSSGELSTGPHLHYEVLHDGVHLNPENFIFSDIKVFDINNEKVQSRGVIQ